MTYQEQALAYLRGEMNEEERTTFEAALFESEALRTELESSRALLDMLGCGQSGERHAAGQRADTAGHSGSGQRYSHHARSGESSGTGARHNRLLSHRRAIAGGRQAARRTAPRPCGPMEGDGRNEYCRAETAAGRRIQCRYQQKEFDLRVSILPTVTGERITARILDRSNVFRELDTLGMDEPTLAAVKRLMERPRGYVILTGAAASGKTTLAYALLHYAHTVSAPTANILTVEDPVEYQIPGVSQVAVNRRNGLTYANALRGMMRSDPDIIYVAECRSQEIAELSIEAAVTGHLVLSILHVGSAVQVAQRLRDIGIVNHLLAGNLAGAIGLRLVRRICPDCSAPYTPSERDLSRAGLSLLEDGPFRKGTGCDTCRQTGYRGARRPV